MKTVLAFCAAMAIAVSALADPVTLGRFDVRNGGHMTIANDEFSFEGFAVPGGGAGPFLLSVVPGTVLRIDARWLGMDLPGIATIGETSFETGSVLADAQMFCEWLAEIDIPSTFVGDVLTAPFTFTGMLTWTGGSLALSGSGLATATIANQTIFGVSYEFDNPAVTPEPTTWIFVATGLALCYRKGGRRCWHG